MDSRVLFVVVDTVDICTDSGRDFVRVMDIGLFTDGLVSGDTTRLEMFAI